MMSVSRIDNFRYVRVILRVGQGPFPKAGLRQDVVISGDRFLQFLLYLSTIYA